MSAACMALIRQPCGQVLDWDLSHLPQRLSFGLQQLICVARAMCVCSVTIELCLDSVTISGAVGRA
jgi:predicted ABC-type transport system involved in lysophospholipase L1 biosynthesis ATPase subunit